MIFSTKYNEKDEQSIFCGCQVRSDNRLLLSRFDIEFAPFMKAVNLEQFKRVLNLGSDVSYNERRLQAIERILLANCQKEPRPTFHKNWQILASDIRTYIQAASLTERCKLELSAYLFPSINGDYVCKEEVIGNDNIYAFGTQYLPKNRINYGEIWGTTLVELFSKNADKTILCLHSSTDWPTEELGFNERFSLVLSNKNACTDVFLFHHEPDKEAVANALHMKGHSLGEVWDVIEKTKS